VSRTVKVQLEKPIASARVINEPGEGVFEVSPEQHQAELLGKEKQNISQAVQALHKAVDELNDFQKGMFTQQREKIAELAVEIARKILAQKVQDKDYKIEQVIKKALQSEPRAKEVVLHLNPDDLRASEKALKASFSSDTSSISFVPDESIGPAECLLETPKGMIDSVIEHQLERVSQALKKVE